MLTFIKYPQKSRGREISLQERDMYISRGDVQSDGRTLCPALAAIIRQKTPVVCNERIYHGLERTVKEKNKIKSPILNVFVLTAIFMVLGSIRNILVHAGGKSPLFITDLRIMCFAAVYLLLMMRYRKKTDARRLNDVRRCIEQREGITAFNFYISELCWCDTSDGESTTYDAYLFSENIFFRVSYDMFNSAYSGDYFTAAVVDTGPEKFFYIVNYR